MKAQIKYLSEAEVIAVNEEMVSQYGGLHGVKDATMLRLAVGRPQMTVGFHDAFKTVFDKAAAMFHSIIRNHPFFRWEQENFTFQRCTFSGIQRLDCRI